MSFNDWKIELGSCRPISANEIYNGRTIALLTKQEFDDLQKEEPDEILISIFGEEEKASLCGGDTRFGYVAWGRLVEEER